MSTIYRGVTTKNKTIHAPTEAELIVVLARAGGGTYHNDLHNFSFRVEANDGKLYQELYRVYDDGSGQRRWLGKTTWIVEYPYHSALGQWIKNYIVFTNIPSGLPEGREPWTIANRRLNTHNQVLRTLEEAIKFASDYEQKQGDRT